MANFKHKDKLLSLKSSKFSFYAIKGILTGHSLNYLASKLLLFDIFDSELMTS